MIIRGNFLASLKNDFIFFRQGSVIADFTLIMSNKENNEEEGSDALKLMQEAVSAGNVGDFQVKPDGFQFTESEYVYCNLLFIQESLTYIFSSNLE